MKRIEKSIIFMLVFLILGIAITLQVRSIMNIKKQEALSNPRIEKIKAQLDNEYLEAQNLKKSIEENEKKIADYKKQNQSTDQNKYLQKQIDYLNLIAGLTEVKGPGVTIILNDALVAGKGERSNYVIHDSDLTRVVDELRKGGVQAISINNERIMATSELLCNGPTIKINKNRYPVPFIIKAIGNPGRLLKALDDSEYVNYIKQDVRVEIKQEEEILIPKYRNNLDELIKGLEEVK